MLAEKESEEGTAAGNDEAWESYSQTELCQECQGEAEPELSQGEFSNSQELSSWEDCSEPEFRELRDVSREEDSSSTDLPQDCCEGNSIFSFGPTPLLWEEEEDDDWDEVSVLGLSQGEGRAQRPADLAADGLALPVPQEVWVEGQAAESLCASLPSLCSEGSVGQQGPEAGPQSPGPAPQSPGGASAAGRERRPAGSSGCPEQTARPPQAGAAGAALLALPGAAAAGAAPTALPSPGRPMAAGALRGAPGSHTGGLGLDTAPQPQLPRPPWSISPAPTVTAVPAPTARVGHDWCQSAQQAIPESSRWEETLTLTQCQRRPGSTIITAKPRPQGPHRTTPQRLRDSDSTASQGNFLQCLTHLSEKNSF